MYTTVRALLVGVVIVTLVLTAACSLRPETCGPGPSDCADMAQAVLQLGEDVALPQLTTTHGLNFSHGEESGDILLLVYTREGEEHLVVGVSKRHEPRAKDDARMVPTRGGHTVEVISSDSAVQAIVHYSTPVQYYFSLSQPVGESSPAFKAAISLVDSISQLEPSG